MAAGLALAAERNSWNKITYIGGTPAIKANSYDWDTTVAIRSNTVELQVAPSSAFGHPQALTLKASQITALVTGPGAWQEAADTPGAELPSKPHGLFGLLNRRYMLMMSLYNLLAIFYQGEDGKPAAILLACASSPPRASLGNALAALSGKQLVYAK